MREQGADMRLHGIHSLGRSGKGRQESLRQTEDDRRGSSCRDPDYGSDPDAMCGLRRWQIRSELGGRHGCDVIDINFGCPVSKIAGRGAGSGMMKYPDKMVMITEGSSGGQQTGHGENQTRMGRGQQDSSWNWRNGSRMPASAP